MEMIAFSQISELKLLSLVPPFQQNHFALYQELHPSGIVCSLSFPMMEIQIIPSEFNRSPYLYVS